MILDIIILGKNSGDKVTDNLFLFSKEYSTYLELFTGYETWFVHHSNPTMFY